MLTRSLGIAGGKLRSLSSAALNTTIEEGLRQAAKKLGIPIIEIPAEEQKPLIWAYPLGVLASDHVGYLSFDLTRLPQSVSDAVGADIQARKKDRTAPVQTTVRLYPFVGSPNPFDGYDQGRFTDDAIVVRAELDDPDLPPTVRNAGIPAMQNPDLTDWGLSPASFAVNPGTLVGQDGCESLLPANVALHEFNCYEVVRLSDVTDGIPASLVGKLKLGIIHEYRIAWYPLGHSLGQIQYSLPLAPGESVNLAVIDWSHRDDAQRTEHTTVDEQIVHNEHRDRDITETVDAAIQELQKGSSFMAGLAESVGVSAAISSNAAIAAGTAFALGGSSSTSSGARRISGNSVQRLSDNIAQVSTSKRELQSTVVVHSVQAEKEAIETRTIVNYNHSHALTILYYEVLRHFRVVTERVRVRPALLVDYDVTPFFVNVPIPPSGISIKTDTGLLASYRNVLKAGLMDAKFASGFDALDRIEQRGKLASFTPTSAPFDEGKRGFVFFEFEVATGSEISDEDYKSVEFGASLIGPPLAIDLVRADGYSGISQPGSFRQHDSTNTFYACLPAGKPPVLWGTIIAVFIRVEPKGGKESHVSFKSIKITGIDTNGNGAVLVNQSFDNGNLVVTETTTFALPTTRAPIPVAPTSSSDEINDRVAFDELLDHAQRYKEYYNRLIWLSEDPLVRAARFDAMKWDSTSTLLDHLDNRAVEIIGTWLAFPTADAALDDIIRGLDAKDPRKLDETATILNERLVTLPARGVFAEAKLGHCNASEEIDNTRFWDWQQSPIPHFAPEIAPVTPVTPQAQQENLQPTPFPQSLVNIVNPPAAPDPTGLASAFSVLGTPNIFRDMSGQAQVADLLKRLSDNTISIAEAANKARSIQAQQGQAQAAPPGGSGLTSAGPTVTAGPPNTLSPAAKQTHDEVQVIRNTPELNETQKDQAVKQKVAQLVKNPIGQSITTTTSVKMIDLVIRCSYSDSKQPLDGNFNVSAVGGDQQEFADFSTSSGVGTAKLAVKPGVYALTISGTRTQFPVAVPNKITVPKFHEHPEFDVRLSGAVSPLATSLAGNGQLTVAATTTRVVINVVAEEKQLSSSIEVDYSRAEGVNLQAEFSIGAKLSGVDLGSVKFGGTSTDIGTSGTKYAFNVAYTYLTGGLTVSQGS